MGFDRQKKKMLKGRIIRNIIVAKLSKAFSKLYLLNYTSFGKCNPQNYNQTV